MVTRFAVYEATVEVHYKNALPGIVEHILLADKSPIKIAEFSVESEALEYLRKEFPVLKIQDGMGYAVKYILVEGMYVQEEEQVLDEEGNILDITYTNIVEESTFPNGWVFDPELELYFKLE